MAKRDPFAWVGHVLDGKYRIDALVGEGGFGVVYRAHHLGFQHDVAVKCLKLRATLDDETRDDFLKRFLVEGKLLHQLSRSTADVVQALDVGVARSPNGTETPYLVLEWLDGVTLDRELAARAQRSSRATIEDAIALLEPAARGLAHAHDQGVSHRDVKPANLMLCDVSGRLTLKVVDFGIAKAPEDVDTVTGPFDSIGSPVQAFTPRYGAPEQFSRRYGATGPWTDVYALALVLVEIVIGHPALQGEDPVQIYIESSDIQRRPTPRAFGVETSDAVEHVLLRALAVDPRNRYRTVGEFWDALIEAALQAPTKQRSIRPPPIMKEPEQKRVFDREPSKAEPTHGSTQNTGTITLLLREQRARKLVWIGALVATAGIVGGAFWGMSRAPRAWESAEPPEAGLASGASASASASAAAPTIDASPAPPNMVLVKPARMVMGSDSDSKNERPLHAVTITHAFYIDRTEVTTEAWSQCVRAGSCGPNLVRKESYEAASSLCNRFDDPNLARQPINCVTQEQAAAYCKFAGKRLPTEAEWELAARGADGRLYPWGDSPPKSCKQAIVGGLEGPCGKRKGTYDVGTTIDGVSPAGAFDMAGNVWEWVADGFEAYASEDLVDPFVPPRAGMRNIVRGGSWDYSQAAAKTSVRLPLEHGWAQPNIGFRCAK